MVQLVLEGGFAEPVFAAQSAFRAIMDALAQPGTLQPIASDVAPPVGFPVELATVALTLCDHDTPVWLDPALASSPAVVGWLQFHTGSPVTADPKGAHFAFAPSADALPALADFALGTDEYPDRSTTLVLALPALADGRPLTLCGPGIDGSRSIAPTGLPENFVAQWADNRELFPRGIDLLLVSAGQVLGLPRSTRIAVES